MVNQINSQKEGTRGRIGLKLMRTEAARTFDCGFALNEAELRRFHDVLTQQIKRGSPEKESFHSYELKFRNGAVSFPVSLDDVLAQENFGSSKIVRLKLSVSGPDLENSANRIAIEFANSDEDSGSTNESIKYKIIGDDRDWVFVTSSQIEERIGKVKSFVPNQLFGKKYRFLSTIVPMFLLLALSLFLVSGPEKRREAKNSAEVQDVENQWRKGALKDPAEVIIRLEKIRFEERGSVMGFMWPMVLPFAGVLLLPMFSSIYAYFAPPYNFLWGDSVTAYEKQRSRGRFLLVGIFLTIVLGVVTNWVSKHIGL